MPIGDWVKRGFVPPIGARAHGARELAMRGLAAAAGGRLRPGVPRAKNYFVLKDYNYSDLYVLFVGHLSDRIARRRAVRDAVEQERAIADARRRGACSSG